MAGAQFTELRLRRSSLHREHDVRRLEDGEDLNDALLDFFVKLGQIVIPSGGLEGGFPSVAYLGSHFFDVLRKGGVTDGRIGHSNVANWAKRRLGHGGLFFDGIGALAVPINEALADGHGKSVDKERHWWLALLLNPRGGTKSCGDEETAILCLDSLARAETFCMPHLRAFRRGNPAYSVEVMGLYRQGFGASLRFRATGDGSDGPIPDPRKSRLTAGGVEFTRPQLVATLDQRGSQGVAGRVEGVLEFSLGSSSRTSGDYSFDFGEHNSYGPPARVQVRRERNKFQSDAVRFLGGFVAKEWETAGTGEANEESQKRNASYDERRLDAGFRMPDVPQQETANDCGFFILEQILRVLQLTPDSCRVLARAGAEMITTLPWPTQKEVTQRKVKLREALSALFSAADQALTDDVETLLKADASLRLRVQSCMWDGPRFSEAVRMMAAMSAPRRDFTRCDLDAMSAKELRALCTQRGVLPHGMAERSDLVRALEPFVSKPRPEPQTSLADMLSGHDSAQSNGSSIPPGPRTAHLGSMRFSAADLQSIPLKILRGLCVQHKVLPPNALERQDYVKALAPLAVSAAEANMADAFAVTTQSTNSNLSVSANEAEALGQSRGDPQSVHHADCQEVDNSEKEPEAKRPRVEHLGTMRFTLADLESMPMKVLRGLCVQHKVLPSNALERADFVAALAHMAEDSAPRTSENGEREETHRTTPVLRGPTATSAAVSPEPGPPTSRAAGNPSADEPLEERRARWAQTNSNAHLSTMAFTKVDLEVMPLKTLKGLCAQHGVLPRQAVERSDYVEALESVLGCRATAGNSSAKFSSTSATSSAKAGPAVAKAPGQSKAQENKKDFSKFLGVVNPNFTPADLEEMPSATLRTLCIQHGVLPRGEPSHAELQGALTELVRPQQASAPVHVLEDDD